jgi:hypothetical protein
MDVRKMIAELQAELARLEQAIAGLERLSYTRSPRRGRPPASGRRTDFTTPQHENGLNDSTRPPVRPYNE